jgi:hypothetical protein
VKFFCIFVLSAMLISADPANAGRVWTDVSNQFNVEAEFVSADGVTVTLRAADGRLLHVPLRDLSKNDYEFVAEHLRSKGVSSITPPRQFPPAVAKNPFERLDGKPPIAQSDYPDYYAILLDPERYSTDIIREMSTVIPDEHKKSWHFPVLLIGGAILWFFSSVLFLLSTFSQSVGWGFSQLFADILTFFLFLPGILVATAFAWTHWSEARGSYLFKLIAFLTIIGSPLLIPSDAVPPPPSIF